MSREMTMKLNQILYQRSKDWLDNRPKTGILTVTLPGKTIVARNGYFSGHNIFETGQMVTKGTIEKNQRSSMSTWRI